MAQSNRVVKETLFEVGVLDGTIHVANGHDFVHRFGWLDAYILKYMNQNVQPPTLCNVPMSKEAAEWLVANCGLEMLDRHFITDMEHQHWLDWASKTVTDEDFDLSFDDEGDTPSAE